MIRWTIHENPFELFQLNKPDIRNLLQLFQQLTVASDRQKLSKRHIDLLYFHSRFADPAGSTVVTNPTTLNPSTVSSTTETTPEPIISKWSLKKNLTKLLSTVNLNFKIHVTNLQKFDCSQGDNDKVSVL